MLRRITLTCIIELRAALKEQPQQCHLGVREHSLRVRAPPSTVEVREIWAAGTMGIPLTLWLEISSFAAATTSLTE